MSKNTMTENITIRYISEDTIAKSEKLKQDQENNLQVSCNDVAGDVDEFILIDDEDDLSADLIPDEINIESRSKSSDESLDSMSYHSVVDLDDNDDLESMEDQEEIEQAAFFSGEDNSTRSIFSYELSDRDTHDQGDASSYEAEDMESVVEEETHYAPWENLPEFDMFEEIFKPPETGIWDEYGIHPESVLPPKEPRSLDKLISRIELEGLKPVQKRIQIEGQKFAIVESSELIGSLFRAVSNAVEDSEKGRKIVQKRILSEIESNWMEYITEIGDYCGYSMIQASLLDRPLASLFSKFRNRFWVSTTGAPLFYLRAAGKTFHFRFVLIDANNYNGSATIYCSQDIAGKSFDSIFYFMRTGAVPDSWFYQLLIPIGSPKIPLFGTHQIFMYDVVQVDRELDHLQLNTKKRSDNVPQLKHPPALCFGLDHRTYFYQPTRTHDLWSLLSEILFHKLSCAQRIYCMAMRMKVDETNYYHYSKLRKRQLTKGHNQSQKLKEQYKRASKFTHKNRGDTQDLQRLSDVIGFSYTLIGLDSNGNFFWKECIKNSSSDPAAQVRKIALFVRLLKNRQVVWHSLDDDEVDMIMEAEVYGNSTFTDTTELHREMYVKHRPVHQHESLGLMLSGRSRLKSLLGAFSVGKVVPNDPSIFRIPTRTLQLAGTTMGIFGRRVSEFITRLFRRSNRVGPEESSQEKKELYLRDNP